jgi:hypothetical protein
LRTSCASNTGAPQAAAGIKAAAGIEGAAGGECAARTIHLVSAVEGCGSAASRNNRPVTPDACAASVSLRLATRSSCRASPQTSSTTAPSASQANASAAVRNAVSTSAARTVTNRRGSRPSSASPLIDSAPDSISVKSWRTQTSGRRAATRPASPATKPVAVALCRPASVNTSCIAPLARPPCSVASASACPSAIFPGVQASPCASMRSMLPRKVARMLIARRSLGRVLGRHRFSPVNPQPAHLFMICSNIKLTSPKESIMSGGYDFREQSQWDRRNLRRPAGIEPSLAAMTSLNGTGKRP